MNEENMCSFTVEPSCEATPECSLSKKVEFNTFTLRFPLPSALCRRVGLSLEYPLKSVLSLFMQGFLFESAAVQIATSDKTKCLL